MLKRSVPFGGTQEYLPITGSQGGFLPVFPTCLQHQHTLI